MFPSKNRVGPDSRAPPSNLPIVVVKGRGDPTISRPAPIPYFDPLPIMGGPIFTDTPVLILGETMMGRIAGLMDT